jgi:hypothetical protein
MLAQPETSKASLRREALDDGTNSELSRDITRYEIMVRGDLSEHFASGFEGIDLKIRNEQITLLAGEAVNEAQLDGLLDCLSDLGLGISF